MTNCITHHHACDCREEAFCTQISVLTQALQIYATESNWRGELVIPLAKQGIYYAQRDRGQIAKQALNNLSSEFLASLITRTEMPKQQKL